MNDAELEANFYIACYHYAKNNGSDPASNFVQLSLDQQGNHVIFQWNHDSPQPTNDDLKVPDLATVQATWTNKTNYAEYNNFGLFAKYVFKQLIKDIEVLKGNPEPDDAAQEALLKAMFDAYAGL